MKKHLYFLALQILIFCGAKAQDAHLSQYFNNPVFYNPSNAGFGIENIRIAANYRSQWSSANPFKTQSVAIDKIVNHVGFGAIVVKNSAGDNGLMRLNFLGGISYRRTVDYDEKHEVAAGMQVGLLQKSFNPASMTFDNQYSYDAGFDPNASSGEVFANTKVSRPDLNFGLSYSYGIHETKIKMQPFAGVSFAHINKPKESFIEDDNVNPVKISIHGGTIIHLTKNFELKPLAIYTSQGSFSEVNIGMISSFAFPNTNTFQLGLFNRPHDALVAYAGYRINKVQLGTSYDITTSELSSVNHGNGGFEISLIYTPQGKKSGKILHKEKTPVKKKEEKPVKKIAPKPAIQQAPAIENSVPLKTEEQNAIRTVDPYIASTIAPKGNEETETKTIEKPVVKEKEAVRIKPQAGPVIKNKPIVKVEQPEIDFSNLSKLNQVFFSKNTIMYDVDNRFDIVEQVIDYMYKYPSVSLLLAGNAANTELGQKPSLGMLRARAVKDYMINSGIKDNRINTIDNKDKFPFAPGSLMQERNQRVDIFIQNR